MRIVGGELSGRRIAAPRDETVRPTSDRAREAIFNMLYSLGLPKGCRVVDLLQVQALLVSKPYRAEPKKPILLIRAPRPAEPSRTILEGLAIYGRVIQGRCAPKARVA